MKGWQPNFWSGRVTRCGTASPTHSKSAVATIPSFLPSFLNYSTLMPSQSRKKGRRRWLTYNSFSFVCSFFLLFFHSSFIPAPPLSHTHTHTMYLFFLGGGVTENHFSTTTIIILITTIVITCVASNFCLDCFCIRGGGGAGRNSNKYSSKIKQEYIYAGERETPEGVGGWVSGTPESNKR